MSHCRVVQDLTISYPAVHGPEPRRLVFRLQNNMPDETNGVKMLSAAIKSYYGLVLTLLRHRLPVFDEIWGTTMNFVFFHQDSTN